MPREINLEKETSILGLKTKNKNNSIGIRLDDEINDIVLKLKDFFPEKDKVKVSDIVRASILNTRDISKEKLIKLVKKVKS